MSHCCFIDIYWFFNPIYAQQQNEFEISGVVKDGTGEPVIGVTVVVKGTQIGTTTDIDGKFKLKVPKNLYCVFHTSGW